MTVTDATATDLESLRNRDDVPVHEQTDTTPADVVEQVAALDDMAGAALTNPAGEVLFRRETETCSWKIPVVSVAPRDDYVDELRSHVRETIGFDLDLTEVVGIWDIRVQTDDGSQTASRTFVTFAAEPVSGEYDLDAATPTGEPVEEAGWFDDLPEGADAIPGTEQVLSE
jgi:hypothetical protein